MEHQNAINTVRLAVACTAVFCKKNIIMEFLVLIWGTLTIFANVNGDVSDMDGDSWDVRYTHLKQFTTSSIITNH